METQESRAELAIRPHPERHERTAWPFGKTADLAKPTALEPEQKEIATPAGRDAVADQRPRRSATSNVVEVMPTGNDPQFKPQTLASPEARPLERSADFFNAISAPGTEAGSSSTANRVFLETKAVPTITRHFAPEPPVQVTRSAISGAVEITFDAQDGGKIRVTVTGGPQELGILLSADRREGLDLLRQNISALRSDLLKAGVESFSFSFQSQGGQTQSGDHGDPDPTASELSTPQSTASQPSPPVSDPTPADGLNLVY